jgi:hypothetical protein
MDHALYSPTKVKSESPYTADGLHICLLIHFCLQLLLLLKDCFSRIEML